MICPICGEKVHQIVKSVDGDGKATEISYECVQCGKIGNWKYGEYDSLLPYKGNR